VHGPRRAAAPLRGRGLEGQFASTSGEAPKTASALKSAAALRLAALTGGALLAARRGAIVARRAVEEEEDALLAEARAAAEAARLELEAAKLRAEAQELERTSAVERRTARAGALLSGRRSDDGTYRLSVEDLPARLKGVAEIELTEFEADRLASACGLPLNGPRNFSFEELASERFDAELERITAQARQAKLLRERQEREAAEAARAAEAAAAASPAGSSQAEAVPADENDDRSTNTRVLACLAYILPLVDSIQFGFYFLQVAPFFAPLFAVLALPSAIIGLVPFGTIILFAACVILGANRDLPRLLRFNLQQAVLLDVTFFLPNLLVAAVNGGALPPEIAGFFFLNLMVLITYCILRNADGEYPDGIPVVSDFAKRFLEPSQGFGGPDPR